jgi:hypothetical protein
MSMFHINSPKTRSKRNKRRSVTLSAQKAATKRHKQALAPWLVIATLGLKGRSLAPREPVRTDMIDVEAVRDKLVRRTDLPPAVRALCDVPAETEAATARLRELVFTVCRALYEVPAAKPRRRKNTPDVPLAVIHREAGTFAIRASKGKAVIEGVQAIDGFLTAFDGAELAKIRRCPIHNCGEFFWAPRDDSLCCSKAHASVYRVYRFRENQKIKKENQQKYDKTRARRREEGIEARKLSQLNKTLRQIEQAGEQHERDGQAPRRKTR